MKSIKWDKSIIDDVVLVGGSTRIPKIQEMLKAFFDGKDLYNSINPDEAVGYGAGIKAAMLGKGNFEELSGFKFTDVTPLSLGTNTTGGLYSIIIPRNTPVPAEVSRCYETSRDGQTAVDIEVLEGERSMSAYNNLLGKFSLSGLQSRAKGCTKVTINFRVDVNGILHATAKEVTKDENSATMDIVYDKNRLSKQEIAEMIEDAKIMQIQDQQRKKAAQARNRLENLCADLKKLRCDDSEKTKMFRKIILDVEQWIDGELYDETNYLLKHEALLEIAQCTETGKDLWMKWLNKLIIWFAPVSTGAGSSSETLDCSDDFLAGKDDSRT